MYINLSFLVEKQQGKLDKQKGRWIEDRIKGKAKQKIYLLINVLKNVATLSIEDTHGLCKMMALHHTSLARIQSRQYTVRRYLRKKKTIKLGSWKENEAVGFVVFPQWLFLSFVIVNDCPAGLEPPAGA